MAQGLERLTKDTPAWYAGTRAREWRRGLPWSRRRGFGGCWMLWVSGLVNSGGLLATKLPYSGEHLIGGRHFA